MSGTLSDLNNFLFEQLERLSSPDMTDEQLEIQLKRTDGVVRVADKIIQNGELAFKTMQHLDQYGYTAERRQVPALLGYDDGGSDTE